MASTTADPAYTTPAGIHNTAASNISIMIGIILPRKASGIMGPYIVIS
jgi:hypothetical protein